MTKALKNFRMQLIALLLCPILFFSRSTAQAAEHTVERGETALQIAIDHDLTLEQLSLLNPDKDLEMMHVGDVLILPDSGLSFEEFRDKQYAERLRTEDLQCRTAADQHVICLFHAENISDLPLSDVRFRVNVRGTNGTEGSGEGGIALMQILPGEKLPVVLSVQGTFGQAVTASLRTLQLSYSELLTADFRVSEELFTRSETILPDGISALTTILFNEEGRAALMGKKINLLAAAYDGEGLLTGVRSLYSDFYPRLDITVYSAGQAIRTVKIFMEAY